MGHAAFGAHCAPKRPPAADHAPYCSLGKATLRPEAPRVPTPATKQPKAAPRCIHGTSDPTMSQERTAGTPPSDAGKSARPSTSSDRARHRSPTNSVAPTVGEGAALTGAHRVPRPARRCYSRAPGGAVSGGDSALGGGIQAEGIESAGSTGATVAAWSGEDATGAVSAVARGLAAIILDGSMVRLIVSSQRVDDVGAVVAGDRDFVVEPRERLCSSTSFATTRKSWPTRSISANRVSCAQAKKGSYPSRAPTAARRASSPGHFSAPGPRR